MPRKQFLIRNFQFLSDMRMNVFRGLFTNYKLKIKNSSPGFTLVELLIVIVVIGILAAFAIKSFSGAQGRGRDAQRKNDLRNIQNALQLYYQDNNAYPTAGTWINSTAGSWSTLLSSNYIKQMPTDPKQSSSCDPEASASCYVYRYIAVSPGAPSSCTFSAGTGYLLEARLENANDTDAAVTQAVICNSGSHGPFTGANKGVYIKANL